MLTELLYSVSILPRFRTSVIVENHDLELVDSPGSSGQDPGLTSQPPAVEKYLTQMQMARRSVNLGYSTAWCDTQPMLTEAPMGPGREPTDAESYRHLLMRAR